MPVSLYLLMLVLGAAVALPFAALLFDRFALKIAVVGAVLTGGLALWFVWDWQPWVRAAITGGAVLLAGVYGFAWERVFGSPYDEAELRGVGPLSTVLQRRVADEVYLTAPLAVLFWLLSFLTLLLLGRFLHAAAMVGVTGVVVLTVRWMLKEPPHRRRRRRRTQPQK
jgi:hypothetical protein